MKSLNSYCKISCIGSTLVNAVHYELRLLLSHNIKSQEFTLAELKAAICNFDFAHSEIGEKFGPLRESVFNIMKKYKLTHNAAQTRLSLRGIPFLLLRKVDSRSEYYKFLIEIIKICNIVFAPVISQNPTVALSHLLETHMKRLRKLFPESNVTPKQHCTIYVPSHIRRLGPPIRAPCFSFESTHNYFKELALKQNSKNLSVSLTKRHQKLECRNFINNHIAPETHPLFSTVEITGVVKSCDIDKITNSQNKFNEARHLPATALRSVHVASWVTNYRKWCPSCI